MTARARCSLFLLLIGVLLWPAALSAQAGVTLDEYWRLLDETISVLAQEPLDEDALAAIADDWAGVEAILLDDGRRQPIATAPLVNRLNDPDLDREALLLELQAHAAQRESWRQNQVGDEGRLQALTTILDADAYSYEAEELNFLQRLWLRFLTFTGDLLARMLGNTGFNLAASNVFALGLVLVLVVVLILIVRTVLGDFVSEAALAEGLERDKVLTADSALTQAQVHAEEGDYRTAVRYLYLSCLLSLEERGLLRYDRSLTNREYLRSVAHVPELASLLRDVVNIFDRVWYGYQPINAETYDHYAAQVQALRRGR